MANPSAGPASPIERARRALKATMGAGTARVVAAVSSEGVDGVDFRIQGVVDFRMRRSRSQVQSGVDSTETLVDDEEVLYRLPPGDDLPAMWMAAPFDPGTAEPTGLLMWLPAVSEATDHGGQDTLDGVPVSRLDTVVDPLTPLGPAGTSIRDRVAQQVAAAGLGGTAFGASSLRGLGAKVAMTVWLDDAGRARRLELHADGYHIRLDLSGFGDPVHIEMPAPDTVLR